MFMTKDQREIQRKLRILRRTTSRGIWQQRNSHAFRSWITSVSCHHRPGLHWPGQGGKYAPLSCGFFGSKNWYWAKRLFAVL